MRLHELVAQYLGQSTRPVPPPADTLSSDSSDGALISESESAEDLPLCRDEWPEEWREAFEERASIIESDGRIGRNVAELAAEAFARGAFQRKQRSSVA